jgi:hypothetical protein
MTGQVEKRTYLYSVDEIVGMMRARIEELCHVWELDGFKDGRDFVAYNPLRNDSTRGSFRVCLTGKYQGKIKEFAGDQSWSPLQFTAALWFSNDQTAAIKWAKGWLGLDGSDPHALEKTKRARDTRDTARASADDEAEIKKVRGWAWRIFLEATGLYGPEGQLLGTPVERYLRGRGIELARLPFPLRSLRYHPKLFHKIADKHFPAMVASINGPDGQFLGVHRTWLQEHADGSVTKPAELTKKHQKKCLGEYRGGLIRLWGGTRVDAETGVISPGRKLGELGKRIEADKDVPVEIDITEGIEDGMTVAVAASHRRIGVGISVSNMGSIKYPKAINRVNFWKQNDAPGSDADKAFERVILNADLQGVKPFLILPPKVVA